MQAPDRLADASRAESLQLMYNAIYELHTDELQQKEIPYTDVSTADWYYKPVKAAYNFGLVEPGNFLRPAEQITRGESAKLLTLFFNKSAVTP